MWSKKFRKKVYYTKYMKCLKYKTKNTEYNKHYIVQPTISIQYKNINTL